MLSAETLCPQVVTSLAPGTSRSTTTIQNATIGLPGLPVIEADDVTAHSTSTCGFHLTASDGTIDVVIASATSDVHNCVG